MSKTCPTCYFVTVTPKPNVCRICKDGDRWVDENRYGTPEESVQEDLIKEDLINVTYPAETIRKAAVHAHICQSMNDTYKRKNADYGDSFCKLRKELPSAILVRIYDKYSRLKNLMSGAHQHVSDESIKDTLMDLANYCVMELVEMEEAK